jgi:hypothetical protein
VLREGITMDKAAKMAAKVIKNDYNVSLEPEQVLRVWRVMGLYSAPPPIKEIVKDPENLPALFERYTKMGLEEKDIERKVRYYAMNHGFRVDQLEESHMLPSLFDTIIPRLENFRNIGVTNAEVIDHAAELLKGDNAAYLRTLLRLDKGYKLSDHKNYSSSAVNMSHALRKKYYDEQEHQKHIKKRNKSG